MILSVRIYSKDYHNYNYDRIVRGLLIEDEFISLEENFSDNGGLSKYDNYSISSKGLKYRNITYDEFKTLNIDLNKEIYLKGDPYIIKDLISEEIKSLSRENKLKNILK